MFWIHIDRSKKTTLTEQIFTQVRDKILKNELKSGEKLPSTRTMALELEVSRNIIIEVFEQLTAEGYLSSSRGSGTYVADDTHLVDYKTAIKKANTYSIERKSQTHIIDFNSGLPDFKRVPRKLWSKFLKYSFLDMPDHLLDYGNAQGVFAFRATLADFLFKKKGISCHPDQIIVLSGSLEGFLIIGRLFKTDFSGVIIEDPVYDGIQKIFSSLAIQYHPIPVDEKGMRVKLIPEAVKDHFIMVTPSHQFPTGSVLSIQRRVRLIEIARKLKTFIVENDYDSEFRHTGSPISSLHLLDPEIVIHIGTFSESIYPSLRLGYMVLPEQLVKPCVRVKQECGLITSSLPQVALSDFILQGHFDRHVNKMKRLYKEKRKWIINILHEEFNDNVTISGDSTGLYIVAGFKDIVFTDKLVNTLLDQGVRVYRVEDHAIVKNRNNNKLILGYGNLSLEQIREGIKRVKKGLTRGKYIKEHINN